MKKCETHFLVKTLINQVSCKKQKHKMIKKVMALSSSPATSVKREHIRLNFYVLFLKYEWFICVDKWFISMFCRVSNYSFRPMEKTYFRILLILVFITSLCNSQDYTYDENYDYYNENYDYTARRANSFVRRI